MKKHTRISTILIVILAVLIASASMTASIYRMQRSTEQECFNRIEESAHQVAGEFSRTMELTQNELALLANYMDTERDSMEESRILKEMQWFCSFRDYCGLVLWYENGRMICYGEYPDVPVDAAFYRDVISRMPYISNVVEAGELRSQQYVYQAVPVKDGRRTVGALLGFIQLDVLPQYMNSQDYDGNCQLYILDGDSGKFIVDEYHRTGKDGREMPLSNLYAGDMRRTTKPGFDLDDMYQGMRNGGSGYMIFLSERTGEWYYTYYTPMGINNWSIQLTIDEPTAFANYREVKKQSYFLAIMVYLSTFLILAAMALQYRKNRKTYVAIAEEANRANHAKSDFLSRMSHDIRTPMNGIVGLTHMMEAEIDDKEKVKSSLEKIKMLTKQLELLINDVLEMSRIESGKTQLTHETFDLVENLNALEPAVVAMVEGRDVALAGAHFDIQHRYVVGSPIHIQRIFMNILSNAVKYNRHGGSVECWLTETQLDADHSEYEFIIQDTGIGMSREFLDRLYEPFARENHDPGTAYSGTGLGMAITKELVDKFGGTINVESTQGVGTKFILRIPFQLAEDMVEEVPREQNGSLAGKKILLVDDSEINREIAQFMLEEHNAIVDGACNGREAVEKFTSQSPGTYDLILMDIMMPEMNGFEATEAIRALDRPDAAAIPIIAMTANAFAEDVQACLRAGMNDHLAKPINIGSALEKITRWL